MPGPIDDDEAADPYPPWSIESLLAVLRRRAEALVDAAAADTDRDEDEDDKEEMAADEDEVVVVGNFGPRVETPRLLDGGGGLGIC